MTIFKCQQCGFTKDWWEFIPDNIPQIDDKTIPLNKLCQCPKCKGTNVEQIKEESCQNKSNTGT